MRLFAKGSRLILIFILTVLISGSILTYLSINNISNYRELTEKKITEEQRSLAAQISLDFQKRLEEITTNFSEERQNDISYESVKYRYKNTYEGVNYPITVDENGFFLWPKYIELTNAISKQTSSKDYLLNIKAGEVSEYVDKDFKNAEINYIKALKTSNNALDSVRVFNARARLSVKTNRTQEAFKIYSKIITEYPGIYNEYGFLYAYYSINQIIKLGVYSDFEGIKETLTVFLENLTERRIATNQYTLDLLSKISEWSLNAERRYLKGTLRKRTFAVVLENQTENSINTNQYISDSLNKTSGLTSVKVYIDVELRNINNLIRSLSNYLNVVENYKNAIKEIVNENNSYKTREHLGDFIVLRPKSELSTEMMVLKKNKTQYYGFVIHLDSLLYGIIHKKIERKSDFELNLDLVEKGGNGFSLNGELIVESEFSPYLDNYFLLISLKDKNIVNEYVFRRRMTYGIGLFLLLGAMIMGLIILIRDVKREKRMKKLRADFVSNVTHELKTPLTSIYMFAESILLGRVQSDSELKKYANIIVKESENLKRMISNILDFSRKESDKLTFTLKENNLSNIVLETMKEMNYWLEISNFKVELDIERDVMAKFESEGLKQALSNLISNAVKYGASSKKLNVRLIKRNKKVFIEIEDFGIGIPNSKLNLIFEKFYRVNSVENESTSGTGLGLTVTRDIILAQNGELFVESKLGKGSKFTIVFNI